LDSVNLVKLILLIQETQNVSVDFNDLEKQNFRNLTTIRETIERLARR
jgi:acyl carrier protein